MESDFRNRNCSAASLVCIEGSDDLAIINPQPKESKMVNLKTQRRPASMIPFISRMPSRSDEVGNLMRRFLGDDLATDFLPQPVSWMPAVEVTENDKEIAITAELPGLSEKEVEVDVDDDVITIRGEKVEEKREEKDRRYHVVERTYGTFRRSFTLPSNIDAQHTHAEFRNGVLTVRLPKTEVEKPRGRKIPIVTR
jgi:HSP20 family protein